MSEDDNQLKPGETIRPSMDEATAIKLVKEHFGFNVSRIKSLVSYDDVNYYIEAKKEGEPEEEKANKFVFKVLNSMDTKKPGHIEAENDLMLLLSSKGINCSVPQKTVDNKIYALIDIPASENEGQGEFKTHLIRLLTFIPGTVFCDANMSEELLFQAGQYIATMEKHLKEFKHKGLDNHDSFWFLTSTPRIRNFLFVLDNQPSRQKLILDVLAAFDEKVVPVYPKLEKGIIHGDFNENNIICKEFEKGKFNIFGVIDFGDSHIGYYGFELAITMCYMMLECVKTKGNKMDPLLGGGHSLAGYDSVRKVPQLEFELLRVCIASRLCQSLVMGAYTNSQDPSNTYVLTSAIAGWPLLEKIWYDTTEQEFRSIMTSVLNSYN